MESRSEFVVRSGREIGDRVTYAGLDFQKIGGRRSR